jgi:hypothetical protein
MSNIEGTAGDLVQEVLSTLEPFRFVQSDGDPVARFQGAVSI